MAVIIKIDDEAGMVLDFMQREIPADHLLRVAKAVHEVSNLIWEDKSPRCGQMFCSYDDALEWIAAATRRQRTAP